MMVLLRLYRGHRHTGMGPGVAMGRAWRTWRSAADLPMHRPGMPTPQRAHVWHRGRWVPVQQRRRRVALMQVAVSASCLLAGVALGWLAALAHQVAR